MVVGAINPSDFPCPVPESRSNAPLVAEAKKAGVQRIGVLEEHQHFKIAVIQMDKYIYTSVYKRH